MDAAAPAGPVLSGWTPPPLPPRETRAGRLVTLAPLDPDAHAAGLWAVEAGADNLWTYLFEPPPADAAAHRAQLVAMAADPTRVALAILVGAAPLGVASYMRIEPAMGCVEIGSIRLTPPLQGTPAATEALSMMIGGAFALGYRRVEWKCDALNTPSRRAALRLGFRFEGVFRRHMVVKGRNRDTAWFAIVDADWPALAAVHAAWLDPANFDADGCQRRRLSEMTAPLGG